MNEVMVIDGFQIPDYVKQHIPENNQDLGEAGAFPTISPRNRRDGFDLKVGADEQFQPAPLPVIILGASPKGNAKNRSFYASGYVPGSTDPPDCASSDGVAPDSGDQRQHASCATCPNAQWGSALGESKGQRCSERKTLYVVPAASPSGQVFQLRVSPTSLKALGTYGKYLNNHGVSMNFVITLVGYDMEADSEHFVLKFAPGGFLDQANAEYVKGRVESPEIQGLIVEPAIALPPAPAQVFLPDNQPVAAATPAPATAPPPPTPPPVGGITPPPPPVETPPPPVDTPPPAGLQLDAEGRAWNKDYHSSGKTFVADGSWKLKRGVTRESLPPVTAAPSPAVAPKSDAMEGPLANVPTGTPPPAAESPLGQALNQWG